MIKAFCVLFLAGQAGAAVFPLEMKEAGEVVAEVELSSPGSDWAVKGREAAVATVQVDGRPEHHITTFAGPAKHTYRVLLGRLDAGAYQMRIQKHDKLSAPGSGLEIHNVRFKAVSNGHADYAVIAHSPVLYAREDTIGSFSDVPLLIYAEELREGGERLLQYTVVFSNEDGGTSTRALMARWGRTTDIEYIYKAFVDDSGNLLRATVQGKDHQELPFEGERDGLHPVLTPVTRNNMVAGNVKTALRFQLAPAKVILDKHSREQVMDEAPYTYQVMAKELAREGKLRTFGHVEREKISDLRNYLFVEFRGGQQKSGTVAVMVRLQKDSWWHSSHLGRIDYGIDRPGWVRTTVELPPGAEPGDIAEIGFTCLVRAEGPERRLAHSASCRVEDVGRVFMLDANSLPHPALQIDSKPVNLPGGAVAVFRVR